MSNEEKINVLEALSKNLGEIQEIQRQIIRRQEEVLKRIEQVQEFVEKQEPSK